MMSLRAASPVEAIQTLEAKSSVVDLMLIDAILPNMSGPEFAEQMLTRYPFVEILF
jgi:CheY-like chemotaxis protein